MYTVNIYGYEYPLEQAAHFYDVEVATKDLTNEQFSRFIEAAAAAVIDKDNTQAREWSKMLGISIKAIKDWYNVD